MRSLMVDRYDPPVNHPEAELVGVEVFEETIAFYLDDGVELHVPIAELEQVIAGERAPCGRAAA